MRTTEWIDGLLQERSPSSPPPQWWLHPTLKENHGDDEDDEDAVQSSIPHSQSTSRAQRHPQLQVNHRNTEAFKLQHHCVRGKKYRCEINRHLNVSPPRSYNSSVTVSKDNGRWTKLYFFEWYQRTKLQEKKLTIWNKGAQRLLTQRGSRKRTTKILKYRII